jgi:hypothetical protein
MSASSSFESELSSLPSLDAQLTRCESALRLRHVPRVTVLTWLARTAAPQLASAADAHRFAAWLLANVVAFVLPTSITEPYPLAAPTVPPEAIAALLAAAAALRRLRADVAALLFAPLVNPTAASLPPTARVLAWAFVAPELAPLLAQYLLDAAVVAASADLLHGDAHTRWCVKLLAAALAEPTCAALADSVVRALLDAAVVRRQRPVRDAIVLLGCCAPLAVAAVPHLRAWLADADSLRAVVDANRDATPLADLVGAVAAVGDSCWVSLAADATRACDAALDSPLAECARQAMRGVVVRLAGAATVSAAPGAMLTALREPALALLLRRLASDAPPPPAALIETLLALVAGLRDEKLAATLTLAASDRAALFVTLLDNWAGAFASLPVSVLTLALETSDIGTLVLLRGAAASHRSGAAARSLRAAIRSVSGVLLERVADADRAEAVALQAFALLAVAFSVADDPRCDAFGDAPVDAQFRRAQLLHDTLDLLRLAVDGAAAPSGVELLKRCVTDVILGGAASASPICSIFVDSAVACIAPLADERRPSVRVSGAARSTSALTQGSLLLSACERHKRARMHSGAALADSAATLFSGKEFVRPAPRAPRDAALADVTAPAHEAGDALAQHAYDLLMRVCAIDEPARLSILRRSLAFRAQVAAGVLPVAAPTNSGSGGGGGAAATAATPQTPAHEPPTSVPSTPVQSSARGDAMQQDAAAAAPNAALSCAWTTAGVPGGDAVGHTTARRLTEWLNESPRVLDLLQLLASVPGELQQERVLVLAIQAALAIHGRRVAAPQRTLFEVRRLASLCLQLGWTTPKLACLAEQCGAEDVRLIMAALRETLGDASAADARAAQLSAAALERGDWQGVYRGAQSLA